MIHPASDQRIVMTLDAGGTNFVFSAMQANTEIVEPITLPSKGNDLQLCLNTIIEGFKAVQSKLAEKPVAISFAFPGPADYPNGIIGNLNNLSAFKGGVALGPMLSETFKIPVFINNDGDLFAYGEAIAGFLPEANKKLEQAGSLKRYRNLLGVTLGTGFGGGIVSNGQLFLGDNSAAAEIWLMRNKKYDTFVEESVSIRAVQRVFAEVSEIDNMHLSPKEIYEIACGEKPGDTESAIDAFDELGEVLGDTLANAITLIDGLVVIGGGLSAAHSLFLPRAIEEMNSKYLDLNSNRVNRLELKAYNYENPDELNLFLKSETKKINIPGTQKLIDYDPQKRIAVGVSKLGTSKAVAIGAYAFALHALK